MNNPFLLIMTCCISAMVAKSLYSLIIKHSEEKKAAQNTRRIIPEEDDEAETKKRNADLFKIEKNRGTINEIIYNNTVYNDGRYRFYPTITGLGRLIEKIKNANETTEYIRITPFYRNAKMNTQMEFDNYAFYIECQKGVTEEKISGFQLDHNFEIQSIDGYPPLKKHEELTPQELHQMKVQYQLCEEGDVKTFQKALDDYYDYLNVMVPKMMDEFIRDHKKYGNYDVTVEDMMFGYFCFEIHSG